MIPKSPWREDENICPSPFYFFLFIKFFFCLVVLCCVVLCSVVSGGVWIFRKLSFSLVELKN